MTFLIPNKEVSGVHFSRLTAAFSGVVVHSRINACQPKGVKEMFRTSKFAVMAALAAVTVLVASAQAHATTATQKGMTYTQFKYDENTGSVPLGSTNSPESASAAYASASTSQSVEIAPGLTLAQATGVAPISTSQKQTLAASAGVSVMTLASTATCAYGTRGWQWGTWPEEQKLYDHTNRCYNGSIVTYRATTVTQSTTLCNSDGTQTWKVTGGTGTGYVIWDDQGQFDCPFVIYVISDHHTRTLQMEATGGGGYWIRSAS
jgi:hypothetical protein